MYGSLIAASSRDAAGTAGLIEETDHTIYKVCMIVHYQN
jgi:hypothetical protein